MVAIPSKVKTTTAKAHNTETRREKHWQQLSWQSGTLWQSASPLWVHDILRSWCLVPRLAACTPQETPGQTKTIFTESSPPQGRQVNMFTGGMLAFVDMIARKFKAQRNTTVQSATAALLSSHLAGIGLTTNPVPVWTHKVAARCCTDFLTLHRFVPMPMLSPSFLATYVAFFRPWWKHTTCNTRGTHVTKHVAVCLGIVRTMTFQRKSAFNPI